MSSQLPINSLLRPPESFAQAQTLILLPGGVLTSFVEKHAAPACERRKLFGTLPHFQNYAPGLSVVTGFIGAPATGMLAHAAAASGTARIILIGMAGGISSAQSPNLQIGTIVSPTFVCSEEGTSKLYGAAEEFALVTDSVIQSSFQKMLDREIVLGGVWTTDGPYTETAEKAAFYAARNVVAVEMECAAVAAVSALGGIHFSAFFVISDLLDLSSTPPSWRGMFGAKEVTAQLQHIFQQAVNFSCAEARK